MVLFYNLLYKYRSKCFVTPLKDTTLSPLTIPGLNTKELLGLFIEPIGICPSLHGLQHFEESIDKDTDIEGNGYCMMWSLLFAEMVLLNPTKPLMSILNELLTITNRDPEQLRKLIRG